MGSPTSTAKTVNGLLKGLKLLELLAESGGASAADLAKLSGFPRPTVYRLLGTLGLAGYVVRVAASDVYRLSKQFAERLGSMRETDVIVEIATPVLQALTQNVGWPCDMATYEDGQLVIKTTTHANSPLSLERIRPGRVLRIPVTATGLTYLAFAAAALRSEIVDRLTEEQVDERARRLFRHELEANIELTRRRGWGVRVRGSQPKTSSIAVPVIAAQGLIGCINLNWIATALNAETAASRYLTLMREAAQAVAREFDSLATR